MSSLQWAMLGLLLACLIVWVAMPGFIPVLHRLKFGQEIRELGPKSHMKKQGTPTMGGVVIILGILIASLAVGMFTGGIDWYTLIMMLVYGGVGFLDDYIKVTQKHNEGLTVRQKLVLQTVTAVAFTAWAYTHDSIGPVMIVPLVGDIDFGFLYTIITFIAIVASTNAVNLSDGLDGLCAGISSIAMVFFLVAALGLGETGTAVFAGAFIGACMGFLRYNSHPANVFMGDTGSMALGGALISVAIRTHMELFFIVAGLLFVIEAASVIIQVGYFKLTHGKRFFKMAPIHHHFEESGWKETRVVSTFYAWAVVCLALAFMLY